MNAINDSALRAWINLSMEADQYMERNHLQQSSSNREDEEGSTTVEYAIGAVATAAFAGLLLAVLKSGGVKAMLNNIIQTALTI